MSRPTTFHRLDTPTRLVLTWYELTEFKKIKYAV